jgi:hypothetical protein
MADIESNNKILKECIINTLAVNVGIKIEIGGAIYIRNNGEREYVVGGVEEKKPYQVNEWKETFTDLDLAISYLFKKRNQDKIGNDFW